MDAYSIMLYNNKDKETSYVNLANDKSKKKLTVCVMTTYIGSKKKKNKNKM